MSGASSLDLRTPIGGLFVVHGGILAVFGMMTAGNVEMYARSGGINANLWWGAVMLVFGAIFLTLAMRAARATVRQAAATPAGAATEAREKATGLER